MTIVRNIGGVIAGTAATMAIVGGVDALGAALFPAPPLMNDFDAQQIAAWVSGVPFPAKAIMVAGWALAGFAGPWLALRIADRAWTGWVVSALFLLAGIANQVSLPHPAWMLASALVLPLATGWLAQRTHRKPYAGEALLG